MPLVYHSSDTSTWETRVQNLAHELHIHPSSVYSYHPEKGVFVIDLARDIAQLASQATQPTLIALYHFETARVETQNALLKTLEESGRHVCMVLCVTDTSSLVPTIMSRCVVESAHAESVSQTQLLDAYGLYPGRATYADFLKASFLIKKEDGVPLLKEVLGAYRNHFISRATRDTTEALQSIQTVLHQVERTHVGLEYALDYCAGKLEEGSMLAKEVN